MNRFRALPLVLCACALLACDDARSLWSDILQKCAQPSDLGGDVLYFGPSNSVGLGSIWRKSDGGGYGLRAVSSDYTDNFTSIVQNGNLVSCSGSNVSSTDTAAMLAFVAKVVPIDAEVNADFKSAKKISLNVEGFRWDLLKELPFEQLVKGAAIPVAFKSDLNSPNGRFVMTKALFITKLEGSLEFSKDDAVKLKAKYSGNTKIGDVGLDVHANWKDESTLALKTDTGFYIAGELRPWEDNGLAGQGSPLGKPESNLKEATIVKEKI